MMANRHCEEPLKTKYRLSAWPKIRVSVKPAFCGLGLTVKSIPPPKIAEPVFGFMIGKNPDTLLVPEIKISEGDPATLWLDSLTPDKIAEVRGIGNLYP